MSAEGFRLVIPQDMLNKLEAADQKLEQLGKTSQKTEAQVIASFKAMAEGVNPFIQKLNEAQQTLANIKGGNINLGVVNTGDSIANIDKLIEAIKQLSQKGQSKITINGIDATASQAVVAVDSINRLIDTLVKLQRMGGQNFTATTNLLGKETLKQMNSEARKMSKTIDKLNEATQKYISTAGTLSEKIREAREAQRQFNEEAKRAAQANVGDLLKGSGKATTLNELKAYANQLKSTMANLDPKSSEWKRLNEILKATNNDIQRINQSMGAVRKTQSNLMNHAQQLKRALALVFSVSQITGYINKLVQVRGEFELQQRSLQAILQNKDEADKLWQQTVDLAVRSPFRVKELVSYTKQLAAYRVETEKLHETTRMLSDVSAGLGVDMQRLILAYGQVKAANYLRGTELRQFSEAGINILGELAKYFTELEGRAVSVGEVFERVSKRMVAFSDVEKIFKRVTSEGGVFFRMQEIQSETIKGLISNLYDQVDLMLNDIGKANDGVLKGSIGLVKEFVESWREVAWYLEKAVYAFALYTAATKLAKLGTSGFTHALFSLGQGAGGAAKGITFLKNAWLGLKSATIVGLITTAAFALLELYRNATKASREAERLQKELNKIYNADYTSFKQQTKTFNDLVEKLKNVNEGSQEHRDIIGKLNSQYGEHIGFIVTEATTYDKLKSSIDRVNEALMRKAKMNTYEKAYAKVIEDSTNAIQKAQESIMTDVNESIVKQNGKAIKLTKEQFSDLFSILEKDLLASPNKYFMTRIQDAMSKYGLEFEWKGFWDGYDFVSYRNALLQQKEAELKLEQQINGTYNDTTAKTLAHRKALEAVNEREKERLLLLEKQGNTSTYNYKKEVDRIKKEAHIERIKVNVEYEFPKAKKEEKESIIAQRVSELNTLSATIIDINNKIEKSVGTLGEKYASIIYIDEAEAATGISQIAENTAQAYKAQQEIIKQQLALKNAKEGGTVYDKEVLDNAQKTAKAYYYKLELLGRLDLLQKQRSEEESKELQLLNKQLAALKEAKQTFDSLRQKFSLEESTRRTAKAFEDLFAELEMTQFTIDMSFDNQGIIDVIEELPNKAGKDGEQALEKMKANLRGGLDVDIKVREDKNLADQIADMFSGYELSLELQKLNIPPDLAKQLFNVDSLTLPDLKEKLQGMESLFVGTDMEKEYRESLRKVDEMERKAQEERLKTYSKYLVKGMDERVRIKIEELRKLEEVEKDSEVYTPQQRKDIRSAIQKEAQEALDKQAWDEFKNTDLYISLFEDLKDASNRSLKIMIERLNSLRESLKDLPPEQLKEIVKQLEKAQDELEDRNPFKKFGNDLKDYFGNIGKRKEAQQGIDDTEKRLTYLRAEAESQRDIIAQYESRIEKGEKLTDGEKDHLEKVKTALSLTEQQMSDTEMAQQSWQKILDSIKKGADGIGDAFEGTGEFLQSLGSYVTDMANKWEQAFGLSDKAKDDIETIAGVAQGAGDMAAGIGKAIANPSDIGAYMQAASGLMTVFATFGQAHDKGKERQIEREIKIVERLQKVYDDLGETIQNAYSLDTLNEATQMSRENLMAQINATKRMIQAEQDKKDTDHERIEEWKEDIEEAKEAMKELEETRLQELGAFASDENKKSGAQAFVDAWFEAYKETGDGLSGLNEQFDEFFEDMIKKQMLQRGTQKYLEGFFSMFDDTIDKISQGGDVQEGINKILSEWSATSPELNDFLKRLAEAMGVAGNLAGSTAELGGLQAGIQGITEDQADVLASYWSSVRLYTADTNQKVTDLITRLFDSEGKSNPMLAELRAQTTLVTEIRDILGGVFRGGHSMGGTGLKVFIS